MFFLLHIASYRCRDRVRAFEVLFVEMSTAYSGKYGRLPQGLLVRKFSGCDVLPDGNPPFEVHLRVRGELEAVRVRTCAPWYDAISRHNVVSAFNRSFEAFNKVFLL